LGNRSDRKRDKPWVIFPYDRHGLECAVRGRPTPRLLSAETRRAEHLIDGAEEVLCRPTHPTRVAGELIADRAVDHGKHRCSVAATQDAIRSTISQAREQRSREHGFLLRVAL